MADNDENPRKRQGFGTFVLYHFILASATAATSKFEWVIPCYGRIVDVIVSAATAPTSSSSIVDVNIDGTTIYTTQGNRPTLIADDTGQYTEAGEPEITNLVPGNVVSYDIDQIGSGTAETRVSIAITIQGT